MEAFPSSSPIQSNSSGLSSNTKNYSKLLLPSYEKIKYDPDANPTGFRPWAKQFRDITIANFGQPARDLYNFIDYKSGRRSERQEQTMLQTVPDIYLAEGLAPKAEPAPSPMVVQGSPFVTSTATDTQSSPAGDGSVTFQPRHGPTVMGSPVSGHSARGFIADASDFTPEMIELNKFLYISLNNSYIGSKGTRLPDVPEIYCLFHYAMLHLWSMDKKNIASRKIQAVEAFNRVQYQGDALKWKYNVLEAIREIYATEYNLNDFIYQGIIDQLKNKDPETLIVLTKQLNILNSSGDPSAPQNWETNLAPVVDYLVTSKAVLGGHAPVQAVLPTKTGKRPPPLEPPPGMTWSTDPPDPECEGIEMVCGNCKQPNHHRRKNCPMGHLDAGPICSFCHNKGHTDKTCRRKARVQGEEKAASVNSVRPAEERAELLSKLASLDAKGQGSATLYVRSGEEVRRIPDADPVATSELYNLDESQDQTNAAQEPYCPSSVLVQEGRTDSDPNPTTNEAMNKRLQEDIQCLMCHVSGHGHPAPPIPRKIRKSKGSTRPTEGKREETVNSIKSDMADDLTALQKQIDLINMSTALPQDVVIVDISATAEDTTPLTGGALTQNAEVVPPENPDDLSAALEQLRAKNKQLEEDLQAYKDVYSVPPSATDPQVARGGMVKIPTSKKGQFSKQGKSWSETSAAVSPVQDNILDSNNITKEVNDMLSDRPGTTAIVEEGSAVTNPSEKQGITAPSAPIYSVGDPEPDKGTQFVVLSLCDGIGCAATAMQKAGLPVTRYIAVEVDDKARTIASYANPKTDHFSGIDHSLFNNIYDIEEKHISAFPRDSIKWMVAGPECSDFSKLRLLPPSEYFINDRQKQPRDSGGKYIPAKSPRKGLDGKKGKTFRQCIKIWGWVKKHHPNCSYLIENVVFNDMDSDWREVCEALGEPLIIDSHDYSATARRRAWWHNNPALKNDPDQGMKGLGPIDPQTCMDPGRTVQTYEAKGKTKVRTIGASWGGNPQSPEQQSRRKVWVHDTAYPGQPQELRVIEAEKLHGMEPGATSAPGMTPLNRLKGIGGGWDIRIATQLFKSLTQSLPKPVCYAADPRVMEKARGLPVKLTKGHLQAIEDYEKLDPSKFSADLKAFYAALLQHPDAPRAAKVNMVLNGSIIDSGASKHVCKSIEIEDGTRSTRLCGFDGSQRWTEGKGYLPIQTLTQSGNSVHLDINDADQYSGTETNLLSMGMLVVQDDWVIHCSKSETYAILPDGERVDLYFNDEHVLCFKHDLRTGQEALRIPGSSTSFLTRYADVRAGSHKRNPAQSSCKAISSYNAYTALQPQAEYNDQGLLIDDGQEW